MDLLVLNAIQKASVCCALVAFICLRALAMHALHSVHNVMLTQEENLIVTTA